jgi:alcohol dehydrogenase class IV
MILDFQTAGRIQFGNGVVKEASAIAADLGKKVLLVTGHKREKSRFLETQLSEKNLNWVPFSVSKEPDIELVDRGLALARKEHCDLVIAIGGGSVMDTGKAIAILFTNSGGVLDHLEVVGQNLPFQNPAIPLIAIPTTAGTGSEVTKNAVIGVPEKKVKASLRSNFMIPRVAIIDPELTYSVPPRVTASTGMDALTQVIEPYVSFKATPFSDLFCEEGMRRAARSIVAAYENGQDIAAREDMCWTSLYGGLSLATAGLGAVHGFANPIGGMFEAAHGAICACLLSPVFEANIRAFKDRAPEHPAIKRYQRISEILTGDVHATLADGSIWLKETCRKLAIPLLRTYGVSRDEFSILVEKASQSNSMKNNPILLNREELTWILEEAFE